MVLNDHHLNNLNDFGNNELMSKFYKYINCTIPYLQTLEGKLLKPYLYIMDAKNINNNLKIKSDFDLIFVKGKN